MNLDNFAKATGVYELVVATRAARERTKVNIGTQVKQGKFRVSVVSYRGHKTVVKNLTDYMPLAEAVTYLDAFTLAVLQDAR